MGGVSGRQATKLFEPVGITPLAHVALFVEPGIQCRGTAALIFPADHIDTNHIDTRTTPAHEPHRHRPLAMFRRR
ncbi:hypothetical protein GCM10023318_22300 [Nocardia callitridis]|uniref:Uncharacterized protein n=1 Tax=Nocardia callitridis TaxID=648753 RepID=A0ABP9K4L0_9NOCA